MGKDDLPGHIAIIMDGNGRWAENKGLPRIEGHRAGVEAVKTVIECCIKQNIPILSLFAFSSENWSRPHDEVEFLMQLFLQALHQEIEDLHQHGICLRFIGDRNNLIEVLQQQMQKAEQLTANNHRLILNVVMNYGGRWDIVCAARALAARVQAKELAAEAINEEVFANQLNTHGLPDPDILIRTGGEQRVSNFFLWQIAYTELYFSQAHWPDFTAEEFAKALTSYRQRQRRFGKISQQLIEQQDV